MIYVLPRADLDQRHACGPCDNSAAFQVSSCMLRLCQCGGGLAERAQTAADRPQTACR